MYVMYVCATVLNLSFSLVHGRMADTVHNCDYPPESSCLPYILPSCIVGHPFLIDGSRSFDANEKFGRDTLV